MALPKNGGTLTHPSPVHTWQLEHGPSVDSAARSDNNGFVRHEHDGRA